MQWTGKKVLVLGAARQGIALSRYLLESGAEVTLNDQSSIEELDEARQQLSDLPVRWVTGSHPLNLLDDIDLLCPSGGVPFDLPIITEAIRREIPLSNDSQIFLDAAPCPIVGITGSAGKTTTTALLGHILSQEHEIALDQTREGSQKRRIVWVGGNIGNPLISDLSQMGADDLAVMELSSFQLEIMDRSPNVAIVLNLTPNHLDRHGTMEAYSGAKSRILRFQSNQDMAVLRRDDPGAWALRELVRGGLVIFGLDEPAEHLPAVYVRDDSIFIRGDEETTIVMPVSEIPLRGKHNLLNVLAAIAITYVLKTPVSTMRTAIGSFVGLPHRLEYIRDWGGAAWYNNSIATAPERTIAALQTFDPPIILLAGGRDKNLPWDGVADEINRRVDHLIAFGEAAPVVLQAVNESKTIINDLSISQCKGLFEAVMEATRLVEPGDVVLLAPGGTSFDEFRDFEERGDRFRKWVNELL